MDTTTIITTIVAVLLGAGGGGGIVGALLRNKEVRADVTTKLADAWGRTVDQLQERVTETEERARAAERTVREVQLELDSVRRETADLLVTLRRWATWVHDPVTDLDRLRVLIPAPRPPGRQDGQFPR